MEKKGTENIEKYEQILGTCGTITKSLTLVSLDSQDKKWGSKNIWRNFGQKASKICERNQLID